jgi:hypothetical protein
MIELLDVDAAPALQRLFERCSEFWKLVEDERQPWTASSGLQSETILMSMPLRTTPSSPSG